ncbi:PREDICTED: protein FAM220A [Condylura cristata]|uniref:protein FAM220A n=1 Tax=Condylura cristata TaxID=143302 RepID=UPI00033460AE|nr:PREDICTED: protein FAM220A [Condylura cristata]XP_012587214.1 PREDICTED: protein FAM220A [Condylura cristata]
MRDRRGTLRTCPAEVKGEGDELDKLLCRLKRTQKEDPCPPYIPCWVNSPAVDVNGNSPNEELSLEMKNDLRVVSLLLHSVNKVLPYLRESIKSASAAAQSETADLFSASAEEHFAGVSCGVGETLVRDWLGGGPRVTDSHRGQCCIGESTWGSGPLYAQMWSEVGTSEGEPPSALPKGLGSELKPFCLHSVLSAPLHTLPKVFLNDETKHVFLSHSKPVFLKQTVGYEQMLSSVKSTSNDLQITLGLLALQAFELADPLCHS